MNILVLRSGFLFSTKVYCSRSILKHQRLLSRSKTYLVGDYPIIGAASISLFVNNYTSRIVGPQFHGHVIKLGLENDTYSLNNLIKIYSKSGSLADGFKVFDDMPLRNLVSWTLIISVSVQNGEFEFGLAIFLDMMRSGFKPNEFTLGSVMKACMGASVFEFGFSVHCLSCKIGLEQNMFVGGSILNMYARSGDIESAELVFSYMDEIDVGCWNAIIGGYTQCGSGSEALNIVTLLRCRGVKMDQFTFINALKGCSIMGDIDFGRQIHGLMIREEVKCSVSMINALMDMYCVNGEKNSALKIFSRMEIRDIISYNTVFGVFSKDNGAKGIANFFHEFMLAGMKPNHITFSVILKQCGELLDFKVGLQFCCIALLFGFLNEPTVSRSLINMFSQFGSMELAYLVFDTSLSKPIIVWNELICAYNLNSCYIDALRTFLDLWVLGVETNEYSFSITLESCFGFKSREMCRQVHCCTVKSGFSSHRYVCSGLIKCYVKFGFLDDAFKFLNGFERLDLASWGALISELVHQNHTDEAIRFLYTLMEFGERPDEFIFGSVLNGCSCTSAYKQTKSIHSLVNKMGFDTHVFVGSAIIDAYAKCGDIESARMAFEQSFKCNDIIMYTSMITAYAHHGLAEKAMEVFEKMKMANLQPSQATFVSVISACSHRGLVEEGRFFFEMMKSDYGMEPSRENFGCLVDLMSRNGELCDAQKVIKSMPFPPWPAIMRSFISGCRIHGNRELGEWATSKLLQLASQNDAAYVLLSKIYSEGGSWEDATKMRDFMIDRQVLKDPGFSWMET